MTEGLLHRFQGWAPGVGTMPSKFTVKLRSAVSWDTLGGGTTGPGSSHPAERRAATGRPVPAEPCCLQARSSGVIGRPATADLCVQQGKAKAERAHVSSDWQGPIASAARTPRGRSPGIPRTDQGKRSRGGWTSPGEAPQAGIKLRVVQWWDWFTNTSIPVREWLPQ